MSRDCCERLKSTARLVVAELRSVYKIDHWYPGLAGSTTHLHWHVGKLSEPVVRNPDTDDTDRGYWRPANSVLWTLGPARKTYCSSLEEGGHDMKPRTECKRMMRSHVSISRALSLGTFAQPCHRLGGCMLTRSEVRACRTTGRRAGRDSRLVT